MKRFKTQIPAILLTIALAIPMLVSCSNTEVNPPAPGSDSSTETTAETATVETTTELTDMLPETNMNGFTLNFYTPSAKALSWALIQLDADESSEDLVSNEIYERNLRIEDRFKCVITTAEQDKNSADNFNNAVLAGDTEYTVAQIYDEKLFTVALNGTLADWATLPYVDQTKPWWNQSAKQIFAVGGYQFGGLGDFNLSEYSKCYVLFFNKEIYETIPQSKHVYDMVNDGTWTLDNFASIAKQYAKDLNGDGVRAADSDLFGYSACTKVGMQMMLTGAGINFVESDKQGNPYFAIPGDAAAIEKMQKILNTMSNSADWYCIGAQAYGGMQDTIFKTHGHSLFQAASMWQVTGYRNLAFDIGILPAPKLDASQERYYTATAGGVLTGINLNLKKEQLANLSIILEAMAFDSRQNLLPLYKETVLKSKHAPDPEASRIIDTLFDSMVFDAGILTFTTARSGYLNNGPFHTLNDTIASTTESIRTQMEASIQEAVTKFTAIKAAS